MAPVIKRIGDLEIPEDLPHQRREWAVERFGWAIMVAIVVAALAGLLGSGPLSHDIAGQPDSALWVEYDRYARSQAPSEYLVHIKPEQVSGGKVRLSLNRDFFEHVEMQSVVPEPDSVEARDGRLTYVFNAPDANQPATVIYRFKASSFGGLLLTMSLADGPQLSFRQFFYP